MKNIKFHIPPLGKREINAAMKAISDGSISGNGRYGRLFEEMIKNYTSSPYALFTTSCTSCIEIAYDFGIGSAGFFLC